MPTHAHAQRELLAELDALAEGGHGLEDELARRFLECEEWQKRAELVGRAVNQALETRRPEPRLSAPPAWLPPLD